MNKRITIDGNKAFIDGIEYDLVPVNPKPEYVRCMKSGFISIKRDKIYKVLVREVDCLEIITDSGRSNWYDIEHFTPATKEEYDAQETPAKPVKFINGEKYTCMGKGGKVVVVCTNKNLSDSTFCGVCLEAPHLYNIGLYSENWDKSQFTPYTEKE